MYRTIALFCALFFCAETVYAQPKFFLPIACDVNKNCWIVNYIDHQSGPGIADHNCGSLTYDGSQGIDFAVKTQFEMVKGVNVLAAASGIVKGTRDGVPDVLFTPKNAQNVKGIECGNGVAIDHGNGWTSYYCHLRRGTVSVKQGDYVKAGHVLGKVGLSGMTQFPHVDFSVRYNGKIVDPFTGTNPSNQCGIIENSLWHPETHKKLSYRPTSIVNYGFSAGVPDWGDVQLGKHQDYQLPKTSPNLIFWTEILGVRAGDRLLMSLYSPHGKKVIDREIFLKDTKIKYFQFVGLKRQEQLWPSGAYMGKIEIFSREDPANPKDVKTIQLQISEES